MKFELIYDESPFQFVIR